MFSLKCRKYQRNGRCEDSDSELWMVIIWLQRRIELVEGLMKAIICWLLGSEQCVWWYHYWAQHSNCVPCSVVGVLQPAGPEGPQCLLESLWWAHRHPPRTGAAGSAGGREKAAQTVEGEWGITGTWEMHALASVLQFREFDKREDWFRTLWHLNMPTCACSEASFCLSVDAGSPGRGALSFAPSENRCGEEQILSCCGRVQSWAGARDQAGATRRQREDHQGTQGVCHTVERATAYVYLKMRWSEENGLSHWPPPPVPSVNLPLVLLWAYRGDPWLRSRVVKVFVMS